MTSGGLQSSCHGEAPRDPTDPVGRKPRERRGAASVLVLCRRQKQRHRAWAGAAAGSPRAAEPTSPAPQPVPAAAASRAPVRSVQRGDNRTKCNHCLQKKLSRIYLLEVTEEYEFYTPFKMLFISLSLGALSTSNFTHSYNSPPSSSCFSSGFQRSHFGLCPLPVQLVRWLETVTRQ